jgi:hypothetical protein
MRFWGLGPLIWMFLLSMAGGAFLELADMPETPFGFVVAAIVGKAVAIYILSGILPGLFWACQRFIGKTEPRGDFLMGWGVLMFAFVSLSYIDMRHDQEKTASIAAHVLPAGPQNGSPTEYIQHVAP